MTVGTVPLTSKFTPSHELPVRHARGPASMSESAREPKRYQIALAITSTNELCVLSMVMLREAELFCLGRHVYLEQAAQNASTSFQ